MFLDAVRKLRNLHLSAVEDLFQLSDLLLVHVQRVALLSFHVLNFDLTLGSDFIDLQVFDVLKFGEFSMKVLNFVQEFLFFEFEFRHDSNPVTSLLVKFTFEHFIFGFVLMEEPSHFLILTKELVVLAKDKLDFIFEFSKFFALGFEKCIFLFQDGDVSFEELLHSECMLVEFIIDHLSAWTGSHGAAFSHWDWVMNRFFIIKMNVKFVSNFI